MKTKCLLFAALLLALAACKGNRIPAMDQQLIADMQTIRTARIFLGHQSVGRNLLDGIAALAEEAGQPLTYVSPRAARGQSAFFAESLIGNNGDPAGKCDAFAGEIGKLEGEIDLALLKLCYADFHAETGVEAVLDHYVSTLAALESRYPSAVFIPVTAPLQAASPRWKSALKDLMNRREPSREANLKRCRFNDLLRQRYRGKPIFDLAAVESTGPRGERATFTLAGQTGFSLLRVYTADGGHLNERGSRIAGRELLRTLAAAVRERQSAFRAAMPGSREDIL